MTQLLCSRWHLWHARVCLDSACCVFLTLCVPCTGAGAQQAEGRHRSVLSAGSGFWIVLDHMLPVPVRRVEQEFAGVEALDLEVMHVLMSQA